VEEHNARARRIWLLFEPRMTQEVAVGCSWMDVARARTQKKYVRIALHYFSRRDSAHCLV